MSIDAQTVKKIIKDELPQLMKNDQGIRELILQISHDENGTEAGTNRTPGEGLESKLHGIMGQLKNETEYQLRKLQENYDEIEKIRQEITNNQEEIERIHRLLNAFDRKQDISLGSLQTIYGY